MVVVGLCSPRLQWFIVKVDPVLIVVAMVVARMVVEAYNQVEVAGILADLEEVLDSHMVAIPSTPYVLVDQVVLEALVAAIVQRIVADLTLTFVVLHQVLSSLAFHELR